MSTLLEGLDRRLKPAQLQRLASVEVGIAGLGGLGSNAALLLARSGIRRLRLADPDRVEASNLNRQAYWPDDLGQLKTEALKRLLQRLDPELIIHAHPVAVNPDNFTAIFKDCRILLEAVDHAETKVLLYQLAREHQKILIGASGIAGIYGPAMQRRELQGKGVIVGDFSTAEDGGHPTMAPRVTMAAAMQAEAALKYILQETTDN